MDYDVIILGAGTMGVATCFEFVTGSDYAHRGRRILLLDRFAPPHTMGSHHGDVRMFRMTYYEHPAYVPFLKLALKKWGFYGSMVGRHAPNRRCGLYMGRPDSELITGCEEAARQHGMSVTRMTRDEIRKKYPLFEVPEDYVGVFDYQAGYLECERIVAGLRRCCDNLTKPREGMKSMYPQLDVKLNTPVLSWESDGEKAKVITAEGTYTCNHLVITAGAWASQLLKDLDLKLTVTRQVQGWITTTETKFEKYPCWAFDGGDGSIFYGFPALADDRLPKEQRVLEVKCGRHIKGAVTDPDTVDRTVSPADVDDFMAPARRFIPAIANAPAAQTRASICLYTNSPDGHYLIDRHPNHKNVLFAAGFSGHGFKATPAVADTLKKMIDKPEKGHPAWFFSLERFTGPKLRLVGRR